MLKIPGTIKMPHSGRPGLWVAPWAVLLATVAGLALAQCAASPPPRELPRPVDGQFTEAQLQQRHEFMLDAVVERPGRFARFLAEQDRLRRVRTRADFEKVMAEQDRLLTELSRLRARDTETFSSLLDEQRRLRLAALEKERLDAASRDAAFARVLAEQERLLAEFRQREERADESLARIQAEQRAFAARQEELRRLQAERTLRDFRQAEEQRMMIRDRDDQPFFSLLQESERRIEQRERERMEFESRFFELRNQAFIEQARTIPPPPAPAP